MDTWNNVPKLKAHCTLIIKIIILVQCSVVLFPRWLHSKRVETLVARYLCLTWAECPGWLLKWDFGVTSTLPCALNICSWVPSVPHDFCSLYRRDTVTVKLLPAWLLRFCTAERFSHCGIWGLGLSGDTELALHLGLHAALFWKGSFPVWFLMVSHGLYLLKTGE